MRNKETEEKMNEGENKMMFLREVKSVRKEKERMILLTKDRNIELVISTEERD